MLLSILLIVFFFGALALVARLVERTLPPRNRMVRRGREERNAMSRLVEKYGRWSGGGGGAGGA